MNREKIGQRVLVLNVAYDHATLRAAYAAGRTLGATHLVFSHMDEAQQWGRAWDFLCDGALEPLFLSTGTALSGECTQDVWDAVVRKTLAAAGSGDAGDESQGARPVPVNGPTRGAYPHEVYFYPWRTDWIPRGDYRRLGCRPKRQFNPVGLDVRRRRRRLPFPLVLVGAASGHEGNLLGPPARRRSCRSSKEEKLS